MRNLLAALILVASAASCRELVPVARDRWVIGKLPVAITFIRDDAGRVTSLLLAGEGQMVEGRKLP